MKKILSIALVAILAAGSAFATFSGDASVAFGYNWETGEYGFTNGTGVDFELDLATADAEKIAEGSVYAGIKANFALKLGEKVKTDDSYEKGDGTLIFGDGVDNAALGVFFEVEEAYVAGENWKVAITGTQGAPDFAKSAIDETKTKEVKDIFGNVDKLENEPMTYSVAANKAAGVTATVYDWTASFGLVGNSGENQFGPKAEKYFNYNAFLQTPEFDFDVVSFQAAAIASRKVDEAIDITNPDDPNAFKDALNKYYDSAIGASAKVGFDADIVTGSVAADYGVKLIENPSNDEYIDFHGLDIAANLAISPITLDVYYAFDNMGIKLLDLQGMEDIPSEFILGSNFLSAQAKVDLAAFDIPVSLTVYGKNLLAAKGDAAMVSKVLFDKDGQDFGGKIAVNFGAIEASVDGGFVCSTEKLYLGADVAYKHDLFTAKAGIDWSMMTASDKDNNVLALNASVESSAIIPGATLSLTYGAADEDMNLLDKQINSSVKAQNLGKVEAKCKITF